MNYYEHKEAAFQIWLKHVKQCAAELAASDENFALEYQLNEYEIGQMRDSFEECEQLKILDSAHVKLKWEHRCWWADCKHPVFHGEYYCVVALPKWEKPHVAFGGNDPHQRKLGEEE